MNSKKEKCLIKKHRRFLWLEWESKYYKHDWGYRNNKERKCLKCGITEILIKELGIDDTLHLKWVKKI